MRVSYNALVKLATIKGLNVERDGHNIEVWADDNHGVTAVCGSVQEAYQTVYWYEKGKGL
jgi:hypothetical protein